jgi:hypothetical protein
MPGFFLPSSARALPPFLASLPARRALVQRSLFCRRFLRLGLGSGLLLGLFSSLGSAAAASACWRIWPFGLHAPAFPSVRVPEWLEKLVMATHLLSRARNVLTDDLGPWRRCRDLRRFVELFGYWFFKNRREWAVAGSSMTGSGMGSGAGGISTPAVPRARQAHPEGFRRCRA